MQKNRLFIVLACLNCAHTTHAVEKSIAQVEEQDPLQKSLKECLVDCLRKCSKRFWEGSLELERLRQVKRWGDVKAKKDYILTHYTDMLERAKTMQAHAPAELGQDIDDIMGEINNLNKVVNEEGIKQLGTMDERIEFIAIQTRFFHGMENVGDVRDAWNAQIYKNGFKSLGDLDDDANTTESYDIFVCWPPHAQECLLEILKDALSEKMSTSFQTLVFMKRHRERQMNAEMEIPANQTRCSTKENIRRVQIPSQEEATERRNRLKKDGVDTSL